MSKKYPAIHPGIRAELQISDEESDVHFWDRARKVCKPCWELRYCPYGGLVEDFPLLSRSHEAKRERVETLRESVSAGTDIRKSNLASNYPKLVELFRTTLMQRYAELHGEGLAQQYLETLEDKAEELQSQPKELTDSEIRQFQQEISFFDAHGYPETLPSEIHELQCTVFGHVCPVIYSSAAFTETSEQRREGRYIPFGVKMRVVRRDNYTCQHCGIHLRDDEVEFDHIIPVSKGGSSEEHNIRLTCFDCNRSKSDQVQI